MLGAVTTAAENRPVNVAVPVILYLGLLSLSLDAKIRDRRDVD